MQNEPSVTEDLLKFKVACKNCTLFQLCLPVGMAAADLELLDRIIKRRRPIQRGEHLFRIGDPFRSIYAVRSGSVKTYTMLEDGRQQVTGFHLPGELLGLDAINLDHHPCSAKALEATSVCEVPFDRLEELGREVPSLPRQMLRIMSKEILHDQSLLLQLGKNSSEERLAAFLLNLSSRFQQRGFSTREYNLSMSRVDIGNYLGLAEETVSRLFTRFQEQGLITVQRKHVRILDLEKLKELTGLSQGTKNTVPAPPRRA
ncbi:MAG: transcriptional regulator [Candidatus Muproteobacteria bacterium RBG_16_65_31]|uniref:Transcriptional regulator n=1 Tax=Candidatus Muproteobacteria bacterium RBG_16_65_31 TaxID=1817759 RepID=A0A1F6TBP2_9PROT|nr:MAG: transcriptional regulator [Candidatus Muproteobacteria bacterium RBG_16_65_31]